MLLNNYRNAFITTLLCLHLAAGVFALGMDFLKPFSTGEATAAFVRQYKSPDMIVVGYPDHATNFLSAYLGGEIYDLESDVFGSFTVLSRNRKEVKGEEVAEKVRRIMEAQNKDVLLVSSYSLNGDTTPLDFSELASFT